MLIFIFLEMFRFTDSEKLKNCRKVQKFAYLFLQIQICARDIFTFKEGGGGLGEERGITSANFYATSLDSI